MIKYPYFIELPIEMVLIEEQNKADKGLIEEDEVTTNIVGCNFEINEISNYYEYTRTKDNKKAVMIELKNGHEVVILLSLKDFESIFFEAIMDYKSSIELTLKKALKVA